MDVVLDQSSLDFYLLEISQSPNPPVCTGVGTPFANCQAAGYDTTPNGVHDGLVTRFSSVGKALASTLLGDATNPSSNTEPHGIAIDSAHPPNVYVAGNTTGANYPTTPGAFDRTFGGDSIFFDYFVSKLNPTLSVLEYSTFIAGPGRAEAGDPCIAVSSGGVAYVTGSTPSSSFPVTTFAPGPIFGGGEFDAFVTALSPSGNSLVFSTFLGGLGVDRGSRVRLNPSGTSVTVVGDTSSGNFPTTAGAFDTSFNGAADAFVAQLDATFETCIQDDTTGNLLKLNFTTGAYQFSNCDGVTLSGTGLVIRRGSMFSLQHTGSDRRIQASVDTSANRGTASIQVLSLGKTFTLTDRNTLNDSCTCDAH
jgi:hypothetical protein